MKVLFVNPKQEADIKTNLPEFVDEHRGFLPPLGLLYVATNTAKSGHDVKVVDMNIDNGLGNYLVDFKPDVVGITATTFTLLQALGIAHQVKEYSSAKVVMGGIHPSIYPDETNNLPCVDCVVGGEGEYAFVKLLGLMQRGILPPVVKSNGYLEDLDTVPVPDRTLMDYRKYGSVFGTKGYITTMITSRGCPYNCVFCHRPTLGKKFRGRSPDNVIAEMREIKRLGIGEVMIYDDTFAVDRHRVVQICQKMIDEDLHLVWDMRSRVDLVDYGLLKLLKQAGCQRIHYGVEASSDRVLRGLRKGITLKQVEWAIRYTKEVGIETLAYFIFGSPGETVGDMENTIAYAKKLAPDYCLFSIMTPYPATPLYEVWLKNHPDHWLGFARDPEFMTTPYWDEVDSDTLVSMVGRAYREFYTRPAYLLRRAVKTTDLRQFVSGIRLFGRLLRRA